jgi:oligoendopeptidase F
MLGRVGIDIHNSGFWQGGIDLLSGMIDQFEEIYKEWSKA